MTVLTVVLALEGLVRWYTTLRVMTGIPERGAVRYWGGEDFP